MFSKKKVLITGGTGSFGKKFVEQTLKNYPDVARLVIYSRDELKQYEMSQLFPLSKYPQVRFFIGDIRDGDRFRRACEGIDTIIHAAALKHVPIAEYNPMECIKTNIFGAETVINAALDCNVKDVIALSTDKAAAPINLYGATKLCSDKLFVAANNMRGKRDTKFSVVRYGNVFGSRGSVIPFFLNQRKTGTLPITHKDMTRFSISLEQGVNFVVNALEKHFGGEIFIPKIPSYKILDVAKALGPNCKLDFVGIRPGEKLHEEMITESDALNTIEFNNYYVITPSAPTWAVEDLIAKHKGKMVSENFSYHSGKNTEWLTTAQLIEQVRQFDPTFEA
jgi:UDP-N-acetylglucosamine 4,6-dehydratase